MQTSRRPLPTSYKGASNVNWLSEEASHAAGLHTVSIQSILFVISFLPFFFYSTRPFVYMAYKAILIAPTEPELATASF